MGTRMFLATIEPFFITKTFPLIFEEEAVNDPAGERDIPISIFFLGWEALIDVAASIVKIKK